MKVTLGTTTWTEHPALIDGAKRPVTLAEYAAYFPVVEVDTFFYAIPNTATVAQWLSSVPPEFQFITKAYRSMTKHMGDDRALPIEEAFVRYRDAVAPLVATGQLKTVLFQFPPYFTAIPENIDYLQTVRHMMGGLPVAVEFRHASWLAPGVAKSTADFCADLGITLVAADEPHQLATSVPFYLTTTTPSLAMLRLHGRNTSEWNHPGPNWRKERTKYRYSDEELKQFQEAIKQLAPAPSEACVIFNNNSNRDASPNALRLQKMMGIRFDGLNRKPPKQLSLF